MDIKRTLFPQDEEKSNVMPLIVPQTRRETMRSVVRITNPEVGSSETKQLRLPYEEADDAEEWMRMHSLTNGEAFLRSLSTMSATEHTHFQTLIRQFTTLKGLKLLDAAIAAGFTNREEEERILLDERNRINKNKEMPSVQKKRWEWGQAEHLDLINSSRRARFLRLLVETITSGARPSQASEQIRQQSREGIASLLGKQLRMRQRRVRDV